MKQYNLEDLKTKQAKILKMVKIQSIDLLIAKEEVTSQEAQLFKSRKNYEALDRKIFELEHEERITQERIEATRKATQKSTRKTTKKSLSAKLNNILADMSEKELKALIAKHI